MFETLFVGAVGSAVPIKVNLPDAGVILSSLKVYSIQKALSPLVPLVPGVPPPPPPDPSL